jgi:hypothetical protein
MRRGVPADSRLLAYHQAGHAVAAWVLQRPFVAVSLAPPEADAQPESAADASPANAVGDLEDVERDITVLLAGVEAEALVTGDYDWWGAEGDRERAEALIAELLAAGYRAATEDGAEAELVDALGGDEERAIWTLLQYRTHQLIREEPVRSAVAALAAALLLHGTLDAPQALRAIRQGIADADPDLI